MRSRWAGRAVALIALASVVAAAGALLVRSWKNGAEKRSALALASDASDQALPALHRCLERDPDDAELLKAIVGVMIRKNNSVTDTEPFVERWVAASPYDVEALRARIELMTLLTRYDEAIASAETILSIDPNREEVRAIVASLYLKVGRWDDAAREYRRLTEADPASNLLIGLARAELERGHRGVAIAALDRVIRENPQSTEAPILRGLVEFQDGAYSSALAMFQRCRPTTSLMREVVLYHIGLCLDRLDRPEEAQKAYSELKALQNASRFAADAGQRPDDVTLQVRAAEAWLAAGQHDAAFKVLQDALQRTGWDRQLLLALAACYDSMGRPDDARRARLDAERVP